jgi:hypothetical protein
MRAIALLLILAPLAAFAAGLSPGVNVDMGCTSTGQGLTYNGSSIVCQAPQRPVTTVGSLPTCNSGTQGQMMFVTDALAPVALSAVAGSGAVKIGVTCNGTSWIVQ